MNAFVGILVTLQPNKHWQMLVNLLNPKETITVGNDGQATLSAPNRGYSIWVLKMDIWSILSDDFFIENR